MIVTRFSATKKAARLAVYDDMMIKVKNHQTAAAKRTETDLQIDLLFS